mgnify:CR=1 FL=1
METGKKEQKERHNYIQPSQISGLMPFGLGTGHTAELMIVDFLYHHPRSPDIQVLTRVNLIPAVAERLRHEIDGFLADVAKAKTEKRAPSRKAQV